MQAYHHPWWLLGAKLKRLSHQSHGSCTSFLRPQISGFHAPVLMVLWATPRDCLVISQGHLDVATTKTKFHKCLFSLWCSCDLMRMQDCHKTRKYSWLKWAAIQVFQPQMTQDCRTITLQWPCTLLHCYWKNATKLRTTSGVCMTVARLHLWQSCNSASTSGNSPAHEHKTTGQASHSCLTFT